MSTSTKKFTKKVRIKGQNAWKGENLTAGDNSDGSNVGAQDIAEYGGISHFRNRNEAEQDISH